MPLSAMSDSSAEDITIAKVVLAGWRLVEMKIGVVVPGAGRTIYVIYDTAGTIRGSKATRYTAALKAQQLMDMDMDMERIDGLLPR